MNEISDAAKKMRAKRKDYSTSGFSDSSKAKAAALKRWEKHAKKDSKSKSQDKSVGSVQ